MRITNIIDGYLCQNEDGSYSWRINVKDKEGNPYIIEFPKVGISIMINPMEHCLEIEPKILTVEPYESILFTITEY